MRAIWSFALLFILLAGCSNSIAKSDVVTGKPDGDKVDEDTKRGAELARQALLLESSSENATNLWLEAADLGNETAQYAVGVMHAWGLNGVERDETKAILHYYFSALGGHVPAQMALGYRHARGDGVPPNCKSAALYLELAANTVIDNFVNEAGGVEPGYIAERIQPADEPKPEAKSYADIDVVDYYHNLASKGDSQATGTLGRIYYYGARGVERDLVKAHQLLLIAASKGDLPSMTSLAHILLSGAPPSIEKDPLNAWRNFTTAADGGNGGAHNGLGYMYLIGYPGVVEQDVAEAIKHFSKATDAGVAEAFYNLGAMHASSIRPQPKDFTKAYRYFGLAAQKGNILALHKVGHMTLHGLGTMRSCKTATQYFKTVAERAFFATEGSKLFSEAYNNFRTAPLSLTMERYLRLAEMGYEAGETNAARVMDEIASKSYSEEQRSTLLGNLHLVLDLVGLSHPPLEGAADAMRLYERAAEQGNYRARVKVGDYFYYGYGDVGEQDLVEAAAHYRIASEGRDAQANFNLGFQHHYGIGLAKDTHLAKRYYDLAKDASPDAKFAVSIVLAILWLETAYKAFWMGERIVTEDPAVAGWVSWWQSWATKTSPGFALGSLFDVGGDTLLILALSALFIGIGYFREVRNTRRRRAQQQHRAENVN